MSQAVMTKDGSISIPPEVRKKHGIAPGTVIRIIETRSGLLLIPLTNEPMSLELAQEIADWQALSTSAWDLFPYQESP